MRIDGRKIKEELGDKLKKEVSLCEKNLHLAVISVGNNPVIRNFVNIKKRCALDIGVSFSEEVFPEEVSFSQIKETIEKLNEDPHTTGIIVQLPLPSHLDTEAVLNFISYKKDVDVLSREANKIFEKGESRILPPVVGAITEIFERENIEISQHKKVVVLGQGRLVGAPIAVWLRLQKIDAIVVDRPTANLAVILQDADIIISGTGVAGIVKPEMIKKGVVLIDAGTSESGGVIVGDADPRCEDIASIFTPVPGGVGPITVAIIFRNLIILGDNSPVTNFSI